MEDIFIIGSIAGVVGGIISVISFLPQVLKIFLSKSAKDISYGMYFIIILSNILWMTHAYSINSLELFLTNLFILILALTIILLKFKYRNFL